MTVEFLPASRTAAKVRVALAGPAGAGKTFTALSLATAWGSTAVVDTERGRAAKYAAVNGWQFDTIAPQTFAPLSLVDALAAAADKGYETVVVDSLSHYWMGADGMLEQADRRQRGGNSFSGWKEVRPDERRMIDALLSYPGHVIVTLRVKTEYVVEDDDKGKKVPRKVGLRPEQREGIEYEFDLVGDLDLTNTLRVSKSLIPHLSGAVLPRPGAELAGQIAEWFAEGDEVPSPIDYRDRARAIDDLDDMAGLLAKVHRLGLGGAPLLDDDGRTSTLDEYIRGRGRALKAALE
ncbi:ATP-binding protein [Amycolatopsis sp. CA-230715]|uniref:ATP-binding protein n=1 Tax=Amycolatopsis sp. CA-230715 TaxID=2745196 RepID=UPI001C00F8C3|nr:ATP-binding protein [Amycolatopsis sp. CA-230715]QWF81155.1 hypothetical protein HUW46_04581 [Amycolatopsis sp. CA-230715]